jgi:hypothetical protein
MSTARGSDDLRRSTSHEALEVSVYDRVAGTLMALLILIGSLVLCLLVAWMSVRVFYPRPIDNGDPIVLQAGGGTSDGFEGESMNLVSLTHHDIRRESQIAVPQLQDTLSALLAMVSDSPSQFDESVFADQEFEADPGGAIMIGTGSRPGIGDGPGRPGIPPHKRWEIRFDEGTTIDEYARVLDYFEIELGVVGPSQVVYVKNLTKLKPDTQTKAAKGEQRLYMSWRQGKMKEADAELVRRAGLPTARLVLQFYSNELEQTLLNLEHDYRGRDAGTIRRTRFAIQRVGEGYEFYVTDQTPL